MEFVHTHTNSTHMKQNKPRTNERTKQSYNIADHFSGSGQITKEKQVKIIIVVPIIHETNIDISASKSCYIMVMRGIVNVYLCR